MKKSTIRTEKRPKKFRFFGRTQYCLTNTRLSGVLFFVQNKKNDCKTLSFVYIIKTECGIPRCSQQTEEEHRMNEKNTPLFTLWKSGNERSRIASCSSFLHGIGNGSRNAAFCPSGRAVPQVRREGIG